MHSDGIIALGDVNMHSVPSHAWDSELEKIRRACNDRNEAHEGNGVQSQQQSFGHVQPPRLDASPAGMASAFNL